MLLKTVNFYIDIYIYGSGNSAHIIVNYLNKKGIKINGFFVSDEYYTSYKIMDLPVYRISDKKLLEDKCYLIVGFNASKQEIENKLQHIHGINITDQCKVIHIDLGFIIFEDHITYEYISEHNREFERIYELCEDDKSRETLTAFINTKITGNPEYLSNLIYSEQYFNNDIISLSDNTVFMDCGAYNGDTVLQFIDKVNGKYDNIIAFEPDKHNIQSLSETIKKHKIQNIECHHAGVWSNSGYINIVSTSDTLSKTIIDDSNNNIIAVVSIDEILKDRDLQNSQLFIKMDVEGAELKALDGARDTISKYHPILAICAYHKKEDIFEIPKLILSIDSSYKIYFRQHYSSSIELVCYAI